MVLKCIIIEDEPLALKKTEGFVRRLDYLELAKTFDNAVDALNYLKLNPVDLIFLDIQMEEFTGIQFLETLKHKPKIIITSAYEKYALKGYEFDVADYLLKPFTFERFLQAVEKVHHALLGVAVAEDRKFIFVRTESRLEKIDFSDILYIEGKSEYLQIVTAHKKIMTLQTFRSVEDVLPSSFMRIHKSFIVAVDKIDAIERNRIKIKDMLIPISDTYRNTFLSKIAILKK
jgi:two-component system LytT family response regulator